MFGSYRDPVDGLRLKHSVRSLPPLASVARAKLVNSASWVGS